MTNNKSTQFCQVWTPDDFVKKPWKNGGGTTEELMVGGNGADFIWRMSVAKIDVSGPFSLFDGYDRLLVPLSGSLSLAHDSGPAIKLERLKPHLFKGSWRTDCQLKSVEARDFNVIYRPDLVKISVKAITFSGSQEIEVAAEKLFIYCVTGRVHITGSDKYCAEVEISEHFLCEFNRAKETGCNTIKVKIGSMTVEPAEVLLISIVEFT